MGFFDFLKGPDIQAGLERFRATSGAILLDVREADEYAAGHIPGSLNLPLSAQSTALGGKALTTDSPSLPTVLGNPSLLDSSMHNGIDASYINYISNLNYGSVIYARHFARLNRMLLVSSQLSMVPVSKPSAGSTTSAYISSSART